jgi:ABC-2 type transport system permease protein
MMGGLMSQINPFFGEQIIPAMVIFAALTSSIMGLPSPLIEAREAEVLRSYRINGVPAPSLLSIPTLSTSVHIFLVSILITGSAPLLFKGPLPSNWAAYLLVFLSIPFACTGLGSLIGVISGNTRSALLWQQLIYLPSMMLGGLMVPSDMLPQTFVRIGHLLPATYAMQSFLGLAYGRETLYHPAMGVLVLLVGGLVAFGLAHLLFSWDSRNGEKRRHPALAALALLPYLLGALFLV